MSAEAFDEIMRRNKEALAQLRKAAEGLRRDHEHPGAQSITVNKRTHRIRFEGETEDEVTVVIEPRAVFMSA